MTKKILKFNKPSIIEAIVEFRFESSEGLVNILLGLLREIKMQYLPLNNIPLNMRQADPNLQYSPLLRIEVEDYILLLGDKVLGIGCKLPYPGWKKFKESINQILSILLQSNISTKFVLNRYSIKYIDFLDNVSDIAFGFNLGNFNNVNNVILKTELDKDTFVHSIQIVSSANINIDDNIKTGAILDIDSVRLEKISLRNFVIELDNRLDSLHESNKNLFLQVLKESTKEKMEPIYE